MTLRIGLVGREGIVQIAAFCLAIILFVAPARAEDAAHAASRLAGAAAHAMQLADASKDPILSRDYRLGALALELASCDEGQSTQAVSDPIFIRDCGEAGAKLDTLDEATQSNVQLLRALSFPLR